MNTKSLATFKKAFRTNISSARAECNCGAEFHHPDRMKWDFEDEEIQFLQNHSTELDAPVTYLEFDNREYVTECDCWHKKAERLMNFLEAYNVGIAKYLNDERARRMHEAAQMQIINILRQGDLLPQEDYDDGVPF